MKSIIFRCKSISSEDFHYIEVPHKGEIICSCRGESWCSHIEATLVAGERAMVPREDRLSADKAQVIARGRIAPPEGWKSNWRNHRRWRGLKIRETRAMDLLQAGNPVVSIEKMEKENNFSELIAEQNGWKIVRKPTRGVMIHVSDDPEDEKSSRASRLGILVVSHGQWPDIAPLGQTLRERMADLLESMKTS